MPIPAARRAALRKLIAHLNLVAAELNVKVCDRDASFDDIKNLRRRLLLKLHSDEQGGPTDPRFLAVQAAWEEWLGFEAQHKDGPGGSHTDADAGAQRNFRMNAMAFLLTYNSEKFQGDPDDGFAAFVAYCSGTLHGGT